jgi:hypothetical protein
MNNLLDTEIYLSYENSFLLLQLIDVIWNYCTSEYLTKSGKEIIRKK